ncbi:MAG: hypothetical protein AB7G21_07000 [Dehalococcoidia bacterium]
MGLLDRLLGRGQASGREEGLHAPPSGADCPHLAVAPRWDNAADIGHEDRATSFVCDSCHASFTGSEIQAVRSAAAARLRQI